MTNWEKYREEIKTKAEETYENLIDDITHGQAVIIELMEISKTNNIFSAIDWATQEAKSCANCYWKNEERGCNSETKEKCKANNYEYWEDEKKNPDLKAQEAESKCIKIDGLNKDQARHICCECSASFTDSYDGRLRCKELNCDIEEYLQKLKAESEDFYDDGWGEKCKYCERPCKEYSDCVNNDYRHFIPLKENREAESEDNHCDNCECKDLNRMLEPCKKCLDQYKKDYTLPHWKARNEEEHYKETHACKFYGNHCGNKCDGLDKNCEIRQEYEPQQSKARYIKLAEDFIVNPEHISAIGRDTGDAENTIIWVNGKSFTIDTDYITLCNQLGIEVI